MQPFSEVTCWSNYTPQNGSSNRRPEYSSIYKYIIHLQIYISNKIQNIENVTDNLYVIPTDPEVLVNCSILISRNNN